jgi:hypothetical protein
MKFEERFAEIIAAHTEHIRKTRKRWRAVCVGMDLYFHILYHGRGKDGEGLPCFLDANLNEKNKDNHPYLFTSVLLEPYTCLPAWFWMGVERTERKPVASGIYKRIEEQ